MIHHFRNEIGHDVTIEVRKTDVHGVEAIEIHMSGPDSQTEWEISKGEANELYRMLGSVLGWKK